MRQVSRTIMVTAAWVLLATTAGAQGAKPLAKCPVDSVVSGTVCMDKYEASVWELPTPNPGLVKKIQQGKATLANLAKAGAIQHGWSTDDYSPFGVCGDSGQNCGYYALSLPGVTPSAYVTWFQAQAACKNARKRLPSNAEWQAAVQETQDPGPDNGTTDCNTASTFAVTATGSRLLCLSAEGAYDMVGNLNEWVADWVPLSTGGCGTWGPGFSGDRACFEGASEAGTGALLRGGNFNDGTVAGPLSVDGYRSPAYSADNVGFRCAR